MTGERMSELMTLWAYLLWFLEGKDQALHFIWSLKVFLAFFEIQGKEVNPLNEPRF